MLVLKCPQCGKENSNDSAFCNYCGSKLIKTGFDYNKKQIRRQPIGESASDEIDRDFLLANIQDIMRLLYISRNFDENIKALKAKGDSLKVAEPGERPLPPTAPDDSVNGSGYEYYNEIFPVKKIILYDVLIIVVGIIFWPVGLLALVGFTGYHIINNKRNREKNKEIYERSLSKYKIKLSEYNKNAEKNKRYNRIAKPNLAKAINSLSAQNKEALSLLDECYSINIIPSKYRNIYAITFIHDYLTTSKGSLRDALFACDLDKIQSQLEEVIKNQTIMICQLSKIEANTGKMLQQQEQMISHLEKIEKYTYNTARAAEQCAQYNKIIAHNTKVMAFCSAMTYINSKDILDFDPYSPTTIKDFGLKKFRSYYKN